MSIVYRFLGIIAQSTLILCSISLEAQISQEEIPAWKSVNYGIHLLESGARWDRVLASWEKTLQKYPHSTAVKPLSENIEAVREQVKEQAVRSRSEVNNPESLPLQQRIDYYIARFPEVHGSQFGEPGECQTLGRGSVTRWSDAVVKIGQPAIPALIRHLTDARINRSFGYRNSYVHILHAQDVALQCVEAIAQVRFFEAASSVDYLSMGPEERTKSVIRKIEDWWSRNKDGSVLAGMKDRLDTLCAQKAPLYQKLNLMWTIERIDKKAVDSVRLLKSWVPEHDPNEWDNDHLATIAYELARRGDCSLAAQVRRIVADPKADHIPRQAIWCLLKCGTGSDYRTLLSHVRREARDKRTNEPKGPLIGRILDAGWGSERFQDFRIAPLLTEMLSLRTPIGGSGNVSITQADMAMQGLVILTKHKSGYDENKPEAKRFAAMDRWLAWWSKAGRRAFLKQHPQADFSVR